jgi:APA family basic amino acid/polyamine antiporter
MNVVKLGGIAAMLAASIANPAVPAPDWSWPHGWTAAQFGAALVPCLWAYEGWNFIPFVAGEIHKPQRNLPRALAVSIGIVFAVYCASLWIYFRALPLERIAASSAVASDAAIAQLGIAGGTLVTVTMLCALVGCANASVLSCPRVYYAMAKDRVFFRRFTNVHPAFRTPSTALVWQCGWALVLIVSGSYERLLSYCVFGAWIFYAMAAGGVLVLRRRSPHAVRPFRMPGYPYTTVLFVIVAAGFVVSTLVAEPLTSLAGLALVAAGLPVYSFFRRREAA